MDNEFNRVVLGICIIVIICCLFIAIKYENREGIVGRVSGKEIPLQLPVKEKPNKTFEHLNKGTE